MKWFLIKMLFAKNGFSKALKKVNKEDMLDFKNRAIKEDKFELASVLAYMIEFKKYKTEQILNTEVETLK